MQAMVFQSPLNILNQDKNTVHSSSVHLPVLCSPRARLGGGLAQGSAEPDTNDMRIVRWEMRHGYFRYMMGKTLVLPLVDSGLAYSPNASGVYLRLVSAPGGPLNHRPSTACVCPPVPPNRGPSRYRPGGRAAKRAASYDAARSGFKGRLVRTGRGKKRSSRRKLETLVLGR